MQFTSVLYASPSLLHSSTLIEESTSFVQIFDFRFLMDLHVLGCPDHDLAIFESVCLSGCVSVCMRQKFCGKCTSTTNAQNFVKLYILNYTTINWSLSTFEENRSTGGAVIIFF